MTAKQRLQEFLLLTTVKERCDYLDNCIDTVDNKSLQVFLRIVPMALKEEYSSFNDQRVKEQNEQQEAYALSVADMVKELQLERFGFSIRQSSDKCFAALYDEYKIIVMVDHTNNVIDSIMVSGYNIEDPIVIEPYSFDAFVSVIAQAGCKEAYSLWRKIKIATGLGMSE